MKIKTKLLIAAGSLPLLIIFLVGTGWYQLTSINRLSATLQTNYELTFLAEQIHKGFKNEALSLRNIIIFNDDELVQNEIKLIQNENEAITKNIALLESKVNIVEHREMIHDLIKTNDSFNNYKDRLIGFIANGKREEAITLINNESKPLHDEYSQKITDITKTYETNMDSSLTTIARDFRQIVIISSIISFIALIVAIIFVFRTVYSLANRLNHVSNVMTNVANGSTDLSERVEVKANDEIDDIATSFNKMAESLEEQMKKEQKQIWVNSNLAEITTKLTGIHDTETLSRIFLSNIAPLMEAAHAVFYLKDNYVLDHEPVFKMRASYAFKERKHLTNSFRIGEGLIGQAALEKAAIILTEVPADYIRVKSGLGEGAPLNVYVLPVCFEGEVTAVLEIASFKRFSNEQQQLLEELVKTFAIIHNNVIGRIQLAKSLEEAQTLTEEVQAQSEELQSQQEELRVTNEELEEQTQALRQSEEKLQIQQEELEQTNAELKEKAEILEKQNKSLELTNREVEQARTELEEKAQQLELSSQYKSEFLANMSHELRSPLNSLLILSKLLADNHEGNLTDKQKEYSKTIYASGSDLLTLINDILDLAKIESGKVEINPAKISIGSLINYVEQSFRPIANDKNLDFNINIKEGIPTAIYSDEQRVQQVLRNLLSNAFKFTHRGSVTLEVDYISEQAMFAFSIADTGIGVPKEKQKLIFEAFQQADGSTSRKYGGTGLGLSICQEVSTLLGGKIVVESEYGNGSTFTFYVGDYQEQEHIIDDKHNYDEVAVTVEKRNSKHENNASQSIVDETEALPTVQTKSPIKKLLIVDDDLQQRNSLMELIGDKDVILKAVSTGAEAIEEIKINEFDCIVLDLGLTDMTGFDLLEKVKSKVENENLKVFIYTGRDLTSKEELFLNKYAHTIIIKDALSPQRLLDELELYLNENNEKNELGDQLASASIQNQMVPYLDGKKALLVDDDIRNVYALSSVLELYGMNITFAENGVEALELLEQNDDFDIILMDIMMPEMDGYEAIRRVRANSKYEQLPIIAITAKAMKEDRDKCMEVGASDYIVKPVDQDKLISLIKVWLYANEGE